MTILPLLLALASAQEAAPDVEPLPPTVIVLGPVSYTASRDAPGPELALDTCATLARPTYDRASPPADGRVLLQLKLRKGRASLVTVTEVDDGLSWLTPCLKRELAAVEWPVRKGRAEVPVRVTSAPPDE